MILIMEGHDKAGKTTIAEALSKQISYPIFKDPRRKQIIKHNDTSAAVQAGLLLANFMHCTKPDIILDRFYPSEIVYSQVLNRKTNIWDLWKTDRIMANTEARIILCYKSNIKQKDEIHNIEILKQVKDKYFEFANKTKCNTLMLDTTDEGINAQIQKILDWIYKDYNSKLVKFLFGDKEKDGEENGI